MDKRLESLEDILINKRITPVFQTVVSLKSGRILGYEALSRITGESEFDSIEQLCLAAIEFDRVQELERLCHRRALEAARSILKPGSNMKLLININPNTVNDLRFKATFTDEYVQQYNISPRSIIFEITERSCIERMENYEETIRHFKEMGFEIAIDDMGAGYSGLNRVANVQPHFVKLDMHLIRNIDQEGIKNAIVKGLVSFSRASNIKLIAEGIESYEELKTVVDLGVNYAQGFFIQEPHSEPREINLGVIEAIQEINQLKQKQHQYGIFHLPIKLLCETTETGAPDEKVIDVYHRIKNNPDAIGLTVIENNIPVGIITREKLALKLSGRYGFTLHQNKAISTLMDKDFLTVDKDMAVSDVSLLAMNRINENVYDFIVVTCGEKFLGTVTVKKLLQKSSEIEIIAAKQLNPLTGLPGNNLIEQRLNDLVKNNYDYTVAYIDIDNFKVYNDYYGFENGDLVISLVADILRECVPVNQFIGHIGGDDFIVIYYGHRTEEDFREICDRFDAAVLNFYNNNDIQKGYLEARSRFGVNHRFPLSTLTAVVLNNETDKYESSVELSAALSKLKTFKRMSKQAVNKF